jgi:hypothetical protein
MLVSAVSVGILMLLAAAEPGTKIKKNQKR